jgi:putative transposase
MVRSLRYEASGAVYHVMARGDGGKAVFEDDKDHFLWVDLLERACARFGWRVHAWVLMGNHFHLLLKTPVPNLVADFRRQRGLARQWICVTLHP